MRRLTTTAALLLALGLAGSVIAPAVAAPTDPAPGPAAAAAGDLDGAALRRALDAVIAQGVPGAVAEVRQDGRVWRGASGVADLSGRPARADDRFRAGSVTKTFVATVVLQLVAEGRIRLDDPIGRHLPGLIPAGADGAQVTVRQLLGHTSGIPNYTDVLRRQPDPIRALQHSAYTPHELVAMALREPWAFDPGAPGHWQYSNTNYVVLGLLIERAGGHPLGREIERRIVRPLRLTDTLVPSGPDLPGRHLNGYEWLDGPGAAPTDLTGLSAGAFWGPGNMISTTADLNRFQQALSAGRLLPPRLLGEMRDVRDTDRAGRSYGLGLEANTTVCGTAQGPVRGHSGSVPGYNTFSFASADGRRWITLAVNVDLTKTRGADEAIGRVLSTALCRPAPPAQPAAQAGSSLAARTVSACDRRFTGTVSAGACGSRTRVAAGGR
ncbi:serine hydrolase domain-containing protein [Streptomyces sp. NPDC093093]|uniref:serine hydrolase domain-containing protein n=1 Tax=Streptomyces sp. NPDC093093 TaxID=3366025 RepID=UPI0038175B15